MGSLRAYLRSLVDSPGSLPVVPCPQLATCPRCDTPHPGADLCDLCAGQIAARLPQPPVPLLGTGSRKRRST